MHADALQLHADFLDVWLQARVGVVGQSEEVHIANIVLLCSQILKLST